MTPAEKVAAVAVALGLAPDADPRSMLDALTELFDAADLEVGPKQPMTAVELRALHRLNETFFR